MSSTNDEDSIFFEKLKNIADGGNKKQCLASVLAFFGADCGTIHFFDNREGVLKLCVQMNIPEEVHLAIQSIKVGKGMAGECYEAKRPVSSCNIQTDDGSFMQQGTKKTEAGGSIVVPIFEGDDVVGTLGIASLKPRIFSEKELETLNGVARLIATLNV